MGGPPVLQFETTKCHGATGPGVIYQTVQPSPWPKDRFDQLARRFRFR